MDTQIQTINFISALETGNLDLLRKVPKTDLHNHYCFGGNKEFIYKKTGNMIEPVDSILKNIDEMHKWVAQNIGDIFNGIEGKKLSIDACFEQANYDNIKVLDIGEDVWANDAIFKGDIDNLINMFSESNKCFAPNTELRFQIGLSRHCPIDLLEKWIIPFFEHTCFTSIDLYGDELAQPIENFIPIYRKAKEKGLILRAHIGEFGIADDVLRAVELLELNEVQHGISSFKSKHIMNFLSDNNVKLNICPTSNVKLGLVESLSKHPIRVLYDNGVKVTINSDDILVFGSSVSQEYMSLYNCGLFTAKELDMIRLNGFS